MCGRYEFSELMERVAAVVEELRIRGKGRFGGLPKYTRGADA